MESQHELSMGGGERCSLGLRCFRHKQSDVDWGWGMGKIPHPRVNEKKYRHDHRYHFKKVSLRNGDTDLSLY